MKGNKTQFLKALAIAKKWRKSQQIPNLPPHLLILGDYDPMRTEGCLFYYIGVGCVHRQGSYTNSRVDTSLQTSLASIGLNNNDLERYITRIGSRSFSVLLIKLSAMYLHGLIPFSKVKELLKGCPKEAFHRYPFGDDTMFGDESRELTTFIKQVKKRL